MLLRTPAGTAAPMGGRGSGAARPPWAAWHRPSSPGERRRASCARGGSARSRTSGPWGRKAHALEVGDVRRQA
eukprot:1013750-Alexandrium_andersonii.AAC.1